MEEHYNVKQKLHHVGEFALLVLHQVFVANDVDGVLFLLLAVSEYDFEEVGVLLRLLIDPPVPPLGVSLKVLEKFIS